MPVTGSDASNAIGFDGEDAPVTYPLPAQTAQTGMVTGQSPDVQSTYCIQCASRVDNALPEGERPTVENTAIGRVVMGHGLPT